MVMKPEHQARPSESAAPQVPDVNGSRVSSCLEHLKAMELKFKRFLNASRDMRFIVNRKGSFIEINQAGAELFRYDSPEEMLQLESIDRLFPDPEDLAALRRRIEEDGYIKDYEVELERKDGSRFIASITANYWFDANGAVSYEGLLTDVSELRHWQTAFIEAEKQNRELSESEDRIRSLNEHILQMLMLMSHDIRGPLVSIGATLKLLLRGAYGKMDESVTNTVKDLLSRVSQVIGVAEDFLGKAQSVDGSFSRMDLETLDLRQDIIDPVLDELSNDIEHHGILIDNFFGAIPGGTIPVHTNKIWLKAVFRNLFKNAIKYGGKGCRIAFGFQDHGSHYRLNVYNSGSPIPEEHRDRLFTKFGRVQMDGSPVRDGIGLGLYLIKEIINKHGGTIWYEARKDGSDFVFTIAKEKV